MEAIVREFIVTTLEDKVMLPVDRDSVTPELRSVPRAWTSLRWRSTRPAHSPARCRTLAISSGPDEWLSNGNAHL
jgi:hypothetical protein